MLTINVQKQFKSERFQDYYANQFYIPTWLNKR